MNLNKEQLEQKVNELIKDIGVIKLEDMLAGGVVSDVYSAVLQSMDGEKNVVVKYTKSNISNGLNFTNTDLKNSFSLAPETHNFDVVIQRELNFSTPTILRHFPDEHITIMENFADNGYKLLQFRLLESDLPENTAENLGRGLATIRRKMEGLNLKEQQIEKSDLQFAERFMELNVLLYNGRIDMFNEVENDFLSSENKALIWTDGDQKNFAINNDGEIIAFDFGRSIVCDADFMLSNLAGHLGLFWLAGYLPEGKEFILNLIKSFLGEYHKDNPNYKIDEKKFVNYFTASLLHRGMAMRWVDPRLADKIGEDSLKYASMHFGDLIFNRKSRMESINKSLEILGEVASKAKEGRYLRPNI